MMLFKSNSLAWSASSGRAAATKNYSAPFSSCFGLPRPANIDLHFSMLSITMRRDFFLVKIYLSALMTYKMEVFLCLRSIFCRWGRTPPGTLNCCKKSFQLHPYFEADDKAAFIAERADAIRGIATRGELGASRELIDALPHLEVHFCIRGRL